ncbi:MAG TPA: EMC3/TMCO1 family protein [Candidatus Binatia bacterium]|nr:EMC3/TMCO1 family protein [Candidatus Binatia bacterium]
MSEVITSPPVATLIIMAIAAGIAFLNSGINRVLINFFVGWEQYRVMQKEMAEYRSETMAAMRANDKKQIEKLKRKDSQIKNMQAKMMKPQMVQFGISFVYLIVWFLVLTPTFHQAPMAYIPGIGTIAGAFHIVNGLPDGPAISTAIPVFYWYPICSLFFGLLSSRVIGIMPIEQGAI